jgi:lipoate-protein ligase A
MGMDEALLASVVAGGPPTLRLYRWQGAWLSLGYSQRLSSRRLAACRQAGVGVVRRVTGGRAVLHGGDLTYAVAASESELPDGLSASYAIVCHALRTALDQVGVCADFAPGEAAAPPGSDFDCFARAAEHEICVGGKKLAGSAQRRAGGAVLQHGSIRVVPDPRAVLSACGVSLGGATSLAQLGSEPAAGALEQACIDGFSVALQCGFELDAATPAERSQAFAREGCPTASSKVAHRPALDVVPGPQG